MLSMGFLIWITSSAKIVIFWTPKLYALSKVWRWVPFGVGLPFSEKAAAMAALFLGPPKQAGVATWVSFVNLCALPVTVIAAACLLGWMAQLCLRRAPKI